jgi:hypothetical protein
MIRAAQGRAIRKRYKEVAPVLDEQGRRRFAAAEAQALGRGGVSLMARITGLARDRDAQFQYIDENSRAFLKVRQPVISCDINYARNWIMHGSNRAAGQMLDKSVIFGCEGRF